MANIQSTQAFYSLSLQAPSTPVAACTANCVPDLRPSDAQILEARGQILHLSRVVKGADGEVRLQTVCEYNTFSILRGVSAFRIPGTATDTIVVSSDSGRVAILQYDNDKSNFVQVKLETFGKSGIRRTIPGQYLASDPKGRAFMLAATEKNKVAWIVQRRADGEIQISSPHEANTWGILCSDICALDTGWEHPVFAALENDYSNEDQVDERRVAYYTVDLSLNHVVKTWSTRCDSSANRVFAVPGGQDGPSGVLVCSEGLIQYVHDKNDSRIAIKIPLRRRKTEYLAGVDNDPPLIVACTTHRIRLSHEFFMFLQTEHGDVFKLTMTMHEDEQGRVTPRPKEIQLRYFETLPVAKELLIIRKGYIYIPAEHGPSRLYFVIDLAEDPKMEPYNVFTSDGTLDDFYFTPRGLYYLNEVTEVPSLHPLTRATVDNLYGEDTPQIYTLQGSGYNSKLKTIRNGLDCHTFVSSALNNMAHDNLWTLKSNVTDEGHTLLLISSSHAERTIVLKIDETVETVEDTWFITNRATVGAWLMGESTHVQVHLRGARSIYETGQVSDWHAPDVSSVAVAAANQWQLLIGLSTSELCFFFMGDDGALNELQDRPEMSAKISAIAVGPTPKGQKQARYAAVGCDDNTIRILSIDLESPLEQKSIQALSARPTSLEIVDQLDPVSNTTVSYVHIGLQSGLYLRAVIDENGELGDVRTKFLGARPVRLFPVMVHEQQAVLACSARPWLGYYHPQTSIYTLTPLIMDSAAGQQLIAVREFNTVHLQGICGIASNNLEIFTVLSIEQRLSTRSSRLYYTPKAMARSPHYPLFYVAQSDCGTLTDRQMDENEHAYDSRVPEKPDDNLPIQKTYYTNLVDKMGEGGTLKHTGLPRYDSPRQWASTVQVIDPADPDYDSNKHTFDEGEAVLSAVCVPFESRNFETYLAVGSAIYQSGNEEIDEPQGSVSMFRIHNEGRDIELLHKTRFAAPIHAMHPYQGRLAIGIKNELFIYDIGMTALLRKSRGIAVPNQIVTLTAIGPRLVCGDVSESVTYVVFKRQHNRFIPFVDDTIARWTSAATMVDYETVAGGDKFGNIWVVRCPEQASKEADEEGINGYIANERSYLGGAPYRLQLQAHFYTQDIPVSLQRTQLVPGGQDVLFWAGLQGTLGIFVPFVSRDDLDFFGQLELQLRSEDASLTGRDHLMYRGYYNPVKGVVDGDLCERFMLLSYDSKQKIAAELDRPVKEVERKIQDMRARVAF